MSTSMSAGIGKLPCFRTFELFLCSHFFDPEIPNISFHLCFSFYLFIYFTFYSVIMITGSTKRKNGT